MKKILIWIYYRKLKKHFPKYKFVWHKSKISNSYYVQRKKNGIHKDVVRVSDHPKLNNNKNPKTYYTSWVYKQWLGTHITIKNYYYEAIK